MKENNDYFSILILKVVIKISSHKNKNFLPHGGSERAHSCRHLRNNEIRPDGGF